MKLIDIYSLSPEQEGAILAGGTTDGRTGKSLKKKGLVKAELCRSPGFSKLGVFWGLSEEGYRLKATLENLEKT